MTSHIGCPFPNGNQFRPTHPPPPPRKRITPVPCSLNFTRCLFTFATVVYKKQQYQVMSLYYYLYANYIITKQTAFSISEGNITVLISCHIAYKFDLQSRLNSGKKIHLCHYKCQNAPKNA